jgi:hypothetical protein
MARTLSVQHFVACAEIQPAAAGANYPYNLIGISYTYGIPARTEWPAKLSDLWLFVRFFYGTKRRSFDVDVLWLDSPDGEAEICTIPDYEVNFGVNQLVASRAFHVATYGSPVSAGTCSASGGRASSGC